MKRAGLFWQTLLLTSLMFAVVLTITVGLSIWSVYANLFRECENKGRAIAQGISRTSDELLVNRDLATVQAVLDESLTLEGVAYLFLDNSQGEIVCHTFVPQVPAQVLKLPVSETSITVTRLELGPKQRRLDISAPIMAGMGGYIHVGMDLEKVYAAALREAALQGVAIVLIFVLSLGLVSLAVRRITGPVSVLTDCAEALSRHDFATDFPNGESWCGWCRVRPVKSALWPSLSCTWRAPSSRACCICARPPPPKNALKANCKWPATFR